MEEQAALGSIFRGALGGDAKPDAHDPGTDEALEELLSEALAHGRAAWPGIRLSAADFIGHLAAHLRGESDLPTKLRARHASDLYLALGCVRGDAVAVRAFDADILAKVPSFVSRLRGASAQAQEVKQVVAEKLLVGREGAPARIAEYTGAGSLVSWVRVVAVRTAMNMGRRRGERGEVNLETVQQILSAPVNPELDYLKRRYAGEFAEAIQAAFPTLSAEQRLVIRLHTVQGLTAAQLAATLKVSRATVFRWVASAQECLMREARRQLRERLNLTAAELESLVGLVRSQLDVRLSTILGD